MFDTSELFRRPLVAAIREALLDTPVVCLNGPRQSGKSTLVRAMMPDRPYFSLDEDSYHSPARDDPAGFVAALPDVVTIDEIQRVPELLPAIKLSVDLDRRPGRFVLTGSASLLQVPTVTESLAGRMEVAHLLPLCEAEKERKPGKFLREFLEGESKFVIRPTSHLPNPRGLAARLVAGGYPEPVKRDPLRARQWHRQYVRGILERDVLDVGRVRNANDVGRLLELLAVRNAELLNVAGLSRDLSLDRRTVREYVAILERLYLIRLLPAWHRNPGKRLVKAPKVHLVDSGLAATLARIDAGDWFTNRTRMGHLLESFVLHQLMTQAGWTNPDLRFWHFRDKDGAEVDLVLTIGSRTWGIEVKAGSTPGYSVGRGLARLARACGNDFEGGIVLYNGRSTLPMADDRMRAVPLSELWKR
ncbi:MAG: ATP-binding protein [Gemmatimonadetes bacterium]|nr:ATP-binding protein [Gemmatimonadota bacterium]